MKKSVRNIVLFKPMILTTHLSYQEADDLLTKAGQSPASKWVGGFLHGMRALYGRLVVVWQTKRVSQDI
jgi:hypothetical protein